MLFLLASRWFMENGTTRDKCVSRRCSEAVSSLASGPRADGLPWFDFPLVQSASRLRYTDKSQMQRPGDMPTWRSQKNTGDKCVVWKASMYVQTYICLIVKSLVLQFFPWLVQLGAWLQFVNGIVFSSDQAESQ